MKQLAIAAALLPGLVLAEGDSARFETCRAKLKAATEIGFLRNLEVEGQTVPRVTVSPTWDNVDFDVKQGLVETVNCFLMTGKTDRFINLDVIDSRTNKRIARYRSGQLSVD